MKTTIVEHGECFEIAFEAETVKEAALVVRFGMDATKEVRSIGSNAYQDGTITGSVVLGKSRRANSYIPRRK